MRSEVKTKAVFVLAIVAVLVLGAAWLATRSAGGGGMSQSTVDRQSVTVPSVPTSALAENATPKEVVNFLINQRNAMFTTKPDPGEVVHYARKGSDVYEADRDFARELEKNGEHLSGPILTLQGIDIDTKTDNNLHFTALVVGSRDELNAINKSGGTRSMGPAQDSAGSFVSFVRADNKWRILSMHDAAFTVNRTKEIIAQGLD